MNTAQRSFAAGEVAPALYARTDVQRYGVALRTCRNWIVNKQGGASTRPGTEFVMPVYDSGQVVRMIKFVFSVTDTLVLVFGDHTLQFIQNGAPVVVGGSPFQISTPYAANEVAAIQYVQSADVMTLVHPNHPPHELVRHSNVSWSLAPIVFLPAIATPANVHKTGGGSGGIVPTTIALYQVTAVALTTGEQSLPSDPFLTVGSALLFPSEAAPVTVSWDPVPGAGSYKVYRMSGPNGVFGYVGETLNESFVDFGTLVDVGVQPPIDLNVFEGVDNYPATVGYYQQRLVFARTNNAPQTVWASRSALYHNFTTSTPIQDDDAIVFTLVSDEVAPIRHVINLGKLIIFTEGSEWLVEGDGNGVLTPTAINPRIGSYNGSAALRPIKVDAHALYVESLGSAVRQLGFSSSDRGASLAGADLTLYSTHLFAGFTLVDWDWQRVPHFIAWCVRSDGALLGLTYIPEQEMLAWHRHDTQGTVENVCVVPEGDMHRVYLVVRRDVNGTLMRYIERMTPGLGPISEACVLDSSLEYDGRNAGAAAGTTMTLSGGVTWSEDELLTITASGPVFSATDVGNVIILHGEGVLRFTLTEYVSATVMRGNAHMVVPAAMRNVAIAEWDHAVVSVQGLDHLGAVDVGVFADLFVVASPNNAQMDLIHVEAGVATLDRPYAHIRVGLPYLSDLETLDIDRASGPSMKEQRMVVTKIGVMLEAARGLWAGGAPPDEGNGPTDQLTEFKIREDESMDDPVEEVTGYESVNIANTWNAHGRVFLRQIDPVPATVLAVMPMGFLPAGG